MNSITENQEYENYRNIIQQLDVCNKQFERQSDIFESTLHLMTYKEKKYAEKFIRNSKIFRTENCQKAIQLLYKMMAIVENQRNNEATQTSS